MSFCFVVQEERIDKLGQSPTQLLSLCPDYYQACIKRFCVKRHISYLTKVLILAYEVVVNEFELLPLDVYAITSGSLSIMRVVNLDTRCRLMYVQKLHEHVHNAFENATAVRAAI